MGTSNDTSTSTLSREAYVDVVRSLGLDPNLCAEVRILPEGFHAIVFDLDDDGRRFLDESGDQFARHSVFFPVGD